MISPELWWWALWKRCPATWQEHCGGGVCTLRQCHHDGALYWPRSQLLHAGSSKSFWWSAVGLCVLGWFLLTVRFKTIFLYNANTYFMQRCVFLFSSAVFIMVTRNAFAGYWRVHSGGQRCESQEEGKYIQPEWRIRPVLWPGRQRVFTKEKVPWGRLLNKHTVLFEGPIPIIILAPCQFFISIFWLIGEWFLVFSACIVLCDLTLLLSLTCCCSGWECSIWSTVCGLHGSRCSPHSGIRRNLPVPSQYEEPKRKGMRNRKWLSSAIFCFCSFLFFRKSCLNGRWTGCSGKVVGRNQFPCSLLFLNDRTLRNYDWNLTCFCCVFQIYLVWP